MAAGSSPACPTVLTWRYAELGDPDASALIVKVTAEALYPAAMARQAKGKRREQGTIRKRGNSLQVNVYAGLDPLAGKRLYLSASTTDEAERDES